MQDWLSSRAQATPNKLALIIGTQHWRYGELNQMVNAVCARLQQEGIKSGDFVAVLLPNGLPYVCLIHALARLGAILVPLNTRLTPAELDWQIKHVNVRWLISDVDLAKDAGEWLMVTCKLLRVNQAWFEPTSLIINHLPFNIDHYHSVVFTSGTYGKPKGVLLTFANHFWSATASAYRLGLHPNDIWLSVLPLYHVGGLAVLFRSCLYGTAVSLHARFNLEAINQDLDNNPITLISLVPTMLHRLLQSRTHWPAGLRLILLGGAAATPELVQRANALPRSVNSHQSSVIGNQATDHQLPITDYRLPLVAPTYGLTEAASQVATMLPTDAVRKPGSVGKPLMFTSVKIVDESDEERPSNEIGEIVVSGPTVTAGYFQKKTRDWRLEADPNLQSPVSTIHTGDLGYLDDDGDLFLVQRRSDLIVSGGENIYPAEVEAVLRQHSQVTEACVVGIPDAEWGQRVAAMVQVGVEKAVTHQELITFCRDHLAGYKIPRQVELVTELPLTASGKIGRKQVAEQLQKR
ncbi:AMP-binding protein [Candidatus Leptofilum sp.]|uniref:AMP-binding protein n=1 Tax=Candidatus Leptofilum sp. TaxID=3241576 RepID=UPI003B58E7C6